MPTPKDRKEIRERLLQEMERAVAGTGDQLHSLDLRATVQTWRHSAEVKSLWERTYKELGIELDR